jgi:hypothetical protein
VTIQLPATVAAYVKSINNHDAASYLAQFDDQAIVDDIGREFRGLVEIKAWSEREIFDVQVTLEVLNVADHDGETVITTKVDGTFDRTGLPDPLIIIHFLTIKDGKIAGLRCRLAGETTNS